MLSSLDLDNVSAAGDAGLAVALLPTSSLLHASRVRPLNRDGLSTHHVLTMNLIHASTLNREFLEPLAECIAAARQSND